MLYDFREIWYRSFACNSVEFLCVPCKLLPIRPYFSYGRVPCKLKGIFKLKNTLVQCVCYVIADTICRLIQFPTISNKAADARNSEVGPTRILFDKGSETVLIMWTEYQREY